MIRPPHTPLPRAEKDCTAKTWEKLAALAVDDARVRLLMTMTGVDYFAAMLVLAEIVTIDRFNGEKGFCSWMELAPRVHQSGEKTWIGGVGGPGNRRIR